MTQTEFARWREFYAAYPFDDMHRLHRPAAMVASALGGGDLQRRLDWLQPPAEVASGDLTMADINTLRAFGFTSLRKDH